MNQRTFQDPRDPALPPLKPSRMILQQEIDQAVEELHRPVRGLLISGLSAGFGVGFSLFLLAVARTFAQGTMSPAAGHLLGSSLYAIGFIIVILGRMDLFTEFTTIAILPVMSGQATFRSLARLWGLVYAGNLAGAAVAAAVTVLLGPALGIVDPPTVAGIAGELVAHSGWVILLSASVTGWLMGVLSWLITGGRDTISQILFVWIIAGTIGFAGLHHAITGTAEVLAGLIVSPQLRPGDLARFLLWTTLGNAAGGILFAASARYSLHMRHKEAPESTDRPR